MIKRFFGLAPRYEPMPRKFYELADFNTRVRRGIVHNPEYVARMEKLQDEFDAWQQRQEPT